MDAKMKEKVLEMYHLLDTERQGFIDANSFGTLLRWLKFNPTETELQEYVETYDAAKRDQINMNDILTIVDRKLEEPDTIDEFIEAAKVFDHDNDGKIEVAELRYAMSSLGDRLDEGLVDDLIAELDKEKTGLIDILAWAQITFK